MIIMTSGWLVTPGLCRPRNEQVMGIVIQGTGLEGRFKKEGTYVYMWLIHLIVQQKLT